MHRPHAALLALLLLPAALAAVAPPALQPGLRVATYGDIAGTYTSVFKFRADCPDTIVLPEPVIDERQVALVPMTGIVEDDVPCTGAPNLVLVSEATVKQPGLLTALQLPGFASALETNRNANATVMNTKASSSLLVGYDGQERVCGTGVYAADTIHFIIREDTGFRIAFSNGPFSNVIAIPENQKALFITGPESKLCLLTDPTTGGGAPATITTTGNGTTTTATLPLGATPAATPAVSPLVTPVASPETEPTEEPTDPPVAVVPAPDVTTESPAVEEPSASPDVDTLSPSPSDEVEDIPFVDPSTSPAPSDDDTEPGTPAQNADADSGGSACFPAHATVVLESGLSRDMAQLQVGDRVLTASGEFSDLILFTHREAHSRNRFVRITTACGGVLTVSPGHYMHASDGTLRAAGTFAIGDELVRTGGEVARIRTIESVSAIGLYNPQTVSGSIAVDGFAASTYTTAVHPALAHAWLMAPVRWLYALSGRHAAQFVRLFDHGSPLLAGLLPGGPAQLVA